MRVMSSIAPSVQAPSHRMSLGVVVVAWGLQAMIVQALLLREALVLMFGSEMALGLVLAAWLLGIAIGAAGGGWLGQRVYAAAGWLVGDLFALGAASCLAIWAFRGARTWLGVNPGEMLPLPQTAFAALLLVAPVSVLIGAAFPLACAIPLRDSDEVEAGAPERPRFGSIYALESFGGLIGGATFSFWAVEHAEPVQIALVCWALTLLACGTLLRKTRAAGVAGTGFAVLLVAVVLGSSIESRLIERRWRALAPDYELVAAADSRYQNLAVGRRASQFTLYCDGQVSGDFPDPYVYAPLAHFWMCQHPLPRRVLLIGGGAEGLLPEILVHPVVRLDQVELDGRQFDLIRPLVSEADRQAWQDPRVHVHTMDARLFVKTTDKRFDLVIARLPEPTSVLRARLYTREFFMELSRVMDPKAVLCLTAAAAPARLSPLSAEYLACLRATLQTAFPSVIIGWDNPAQVLAATMDGLTTMDPAELTRRYEKRAIASPAFTPLWFVGATDWLDPAKVRARAAQLDEAPALISTDSRPILSTLRLELWEAMTAGQSAGIVTRLRSLRWYRIALSLAALGLSLLAVLWVRDRARRGEQPIHLWGQRSVVCSIATTGFTTLSLTLLWLFAFQNLYGYVYGRIGWILAMFMAGLVVGCLLAGRLGASRSGCVCQPQESVNSPPRATALIVVDLLLAVLAAAAPLVVPVLGRSQAGPASFLAVETTISVLVGLTGGLCGAAFALSSRLQSTANRLSASAGTIVSADHVGACLGALLTGVLLVPVYGLLLTSLLLAGLKLVSATFLAWGWRGQRISSNPLCAASTVLPSS